MSRIRSVDQIRSEERRDASSQEILHYLEGKAPQTARHLWSQPATPLDEEEFYKKLFSSCILDQTWNRDVIVYCLGELPLLSDETIITLFEVLLRTSPEATRDPLLKDILGAAMKTGYVELVQRILQFVEPDQTTLERWLTMDESESTVAIFNLLIQNGLKIDNMTALLFRAVREGSRESLHAKVLAAAGIPYLQKKSSECPLREAVRLCKVDLVEFFLGGSLHSMQQEIDAYKGLQVSYLKHSFGEPLIEGRMKFSRRAAELRQLNKDEHKKDKKPKKDDKKKKGEKKKNSPSPASSPQDDSPKDSPREPKAFKAIKDLEKHVKFGLYEGFVREILCLLSEMNDVFEQDYFLIEDRKCNNWLFGLLVVPSQVYLTTIQLNMPKKVMTKIFFHYQQLWGKDFYRKPDDSQAVELLLRMARKLPSGTVTFEMLELVDFCEVVENDLEAPKSLLLSLCVDLLDRQPSISDWVIDFASYLLESGGELGFNPGFETLHYFDVGERITTTFIRIMSLKARHMMRPSAGQKVTQLREAALQKTCCLFRYEGNVGESTKPPCCEPPEPLNLRRDNAQDELRRKRHIFH